MTKQVWDNILSIAESLGGDCLNLITALGRDAFDAMRVRLIRQSSSHASKSDEEWVIAMWRYQNAIRDRQFTERELDEVELWAFTLMSLRDKFANQYQTVALGLGVPAADNEHIRTIRDCIESMKECAQKANSLSSDVGEFFTQVKDMSPDLNKVILNYRSRLISPIERLENTLIDFASRMQGSLKALEELIKMTGIDSKLVATLRSNIKENALQIQSIDESLNLRTSHRDDSGAVLFGKILAKGERYAKDNPQLYEWTCPQCDWSGPLLKRRPPDESLINPMDKWWVWKCPAYAAIIAYDRKHPQFERHDSHSVVFNLRAWERVCEGTMTLYDMAYFLNTDPEWVVWAAQNMFGFEIPKHVQKEFEAYERTGVDNRDGGEMQSGDSSAVQTEPA